MKKYHKKPETKIFDVNHIGLLIISNYCQNMELKLF